MPNVLVRDLPADIHEELAHRARARGQSLQQFLTDELTRLAAQPTPDAFWNRVAHRSGGRAGLEQSVALIRKDRGE